MKNKFNSFFGIFLILSLIFIIPMNINTVSAAPYRSDVQSMCGGFSGEVKDSFILSAVTGCLPGIIEKVEEQRQYKCRQIVCTYEAVKVGIDPAFCTKEYEYNMCKYIVGEIFALPPMAILEFFRAAVAQILENPIGLLWAAGTKVARTLVTGSCFPGASSWICSFVGTPTSGQLIAASAFLIATDTMALAQIIMSIFEEGFDYFNGAPDYCEQVPEIRKEMQNILGIKAEEDD